MVNILAQKYAKILKSELETHIACPIFTVYCMYPGENTGTQ